MTSPSPDLLLAKRVIVCLDVAKGRVVKGVQFKNLVDRGDPVELALEYEAQGADEIVFLDIQATEQSRDTLYDVVRRTAHDLSIPLSVGGGIGSIEAIGRALEAGADKVSLNSAALRQPDLIEKGAAMFGSQCVVASLDAKRVEESGRFEVFSHGGKRAANREAIAWAKECAQRGAGEILLTSIDRDGERSGFDHSLSAEVSRSVRVPVIASGGAGNAKHFLEVFENTDCQAALGAGIFHEGLLRVQELKEYLASHGLVMRQGEEGVAP